MKLGALLFGAYAVILVICFSYPAGVIARRLRIVYLEGAEEPLVDTANVLAAFVGRAAEQGELDVEMLYQVFGRAAARDVSARLYDTLKQRVDLDVYVTDVSGKLIFDSRSRDAIGQDYSRWLDVSRTLRGEYGARIGRDPEDAGSPRVLYVAAPVLVHGKIAGSLTVVKPTTAANAFAQVARPQLLALAAVAAGAALGLGLLVSLLLTQQVRRLTRYADQVREGRRVPFPKLLPTELRTMGLAFEKMRVALAGQTYVEQYVRALTHEIKSPISAIRGAAEILETPGLPEPQRARFSRNVQQDTRRIEDLVNRMLELAELEVRRGLPALSSVALAPIARTVLESQGPALAQKRLRTELRVADELEVLGDAFLLHLALSNLIKNAVEFSPEAGLLRIEAARTDEGVELRVEDEGPGVPEFAKERIFERFFSLQRPDTGSKSTGLGLNLVREIATLHGGEVKIDNRVQGGLQARLLLPLQ